MDQEAALLAAIAAHPEEDTPRLAYADWLDEHSGGLPEPASARVRAEFIRVQCEIKRLEGLTRPEQNRYVQLYRRQDAILTHHRRDLLGPLGDELSTAEIHRDLFDRGFVAKLELDAARFIKLAAAIAAWKPLPVVNVYEVGRWLDDLVHNQHHRIITALSLHSDDWRTEAQFDIEAIELGLAAAQWTRLIELNLERCQIGDDGLGALVNYPASFPVLTNLDLSRNEISDEGVHLLVGWPLWPRLKSLVLGANPISDEGANTLAEAAANSRLEYLNLKFTGITSEGHRVLLRRFPRRTKLDLF
jgi:uncharacterized protein (TIGR02996 family)